MEDDKRLENTNYFLVLKKVNQKPICRLKDSDLAMFLFLLTKIGFITCSLFLLKFTKI